MDLQQELGVTSQDSKWASFNAAAPVSGCHFADYTKIQTPEHVEHIKKLEYRSVSTWVVPALPRDTGVCHAEVDRQRILRVVIVTGTLALCIKVPCGSIWIVFFTLLISRQNCHVCEGLGIPYRTQLPLVIPR